MRRVVDGLELWWIKTKVAIRVEVCRDVGLNGRTGSKRFKDLTKEEKRRLEGWIGLKR